MILRKVGVTSVCEGTAFRIPDGFVIEVGEGSGGHIQAPRCLSRFRDQGSKFRAEVQQRPEGDFRSPGAGALRSG